MGTLDEKMQPDKKILCLVCQKGKVSKIISGQDNPTSQSLSKNLESWGRN